MALSYGKSKPTITNGPHFFKIIIYTYVASIVMNLTAEKTALYLYFLPLEIFYGKL